jgi:hypothetical protein
VAEKNWIVQNKEKTWWREARSGLRELWASDELDREMKTFAVLVSGFGWHVADLLRAAATLDLVINAVPFPEVSATVGQGRQAIESGGVGLTRVDGVLVRMMPPGSLEQVVFRRWTPFIEFARREFGSGTRRGPWRQP